MTAVRRRTTRYQAVLARCWYCGRLLPAGTLHRRPGSVPLCADLRGCLEARHAA